MTLPKIECFAKKVVAGRFILDDTDLVSLLLTLNCFTPTSSVSVVDFERENVC